MIKTWHVIGTKFGLALTLEKITNVDFNVLTGRAPLDSVSVARRMSWASARETTRVEDKAYSLLGIFGVHMPTIYGEGSNAFLRLQEEIIKAIPDQSIFAWGRACVLASLRTKDNRMPGDTDGYGLLADSPAAFFGSGDVHPLSPAAFASRVGRRKEDVPSLHSVFTPQGVRMELPCIDLAQVPDLRQTFMVPRYASIDEAMCDDCLQLGHSHVLALLQCEDEDGALLALPLCEPRVELGARRGLLVITHISCARPLHQPVRTIRLTVPTLEEALKRLSAGPEPMNLSIVRHYSRPMVQNLSRDCFLDTQGSSSIGRSFWRQVDQGGSGVFRIAPHSNQELASLGFMLSPLQCWHFLGEVALLTTLIPDSRVGRWERRPRGTTELKLTLIRNGEGYDDVPAGASAVHFSVTNRRCIIFADTDTRSTPADGHPSPLSSHHIAQETPFPDSSGGSGTSVSGFCCRPLLAGRVLASTAFVVCWRTDESGRQNVLNRRLLRLALERSAGATNANDFRDVWIAVEISDGYWSWNDAVGADVGNSVLDSRNPSSILRTESEDSIDEGTGPAGASHAIQPFESVQLAASPSTHSAPIVPDPNKEQFTDSHPPVAVSETTRSKALGLWRRCFRRSAERASKSTAQTPLESPEATNTRQDNYFIS